jgi:uncharacterized UBP type Zn finger protein
VSATCEHVRSMRDMTPSGSGYEECLRTGDAWVRLRMCLTCGHVGCRDSSPNRHATAHRHATDDHPLIRPLEPGEDRWRCRRDDFAFEVPGAACAPSYR